MKAPNLPRAVMRRTPPLRTWQRLVVSAVLIGAMLLSAALIFFQPGAASFTDTGTTLPAPPAEPAPALPPGTDVYYYWGQA